MVDRHGTVREVVWQDLCPWLILLRTFRLAISFRVLLLAAVALVGVTAGWRMIGALFSGADDPLLKPTPAGRSSTSPDGRPAPDLPSYGPRSWVEVHSIWPWSDEFGQAAEEMQPGKRDADVSRMLPVVGDWISRGPVGGVWAHLSVPFRGLLDKRLTVKSLAYTILCCVWSALVWALFGGAITRIAALDLTRSDHLSMGGALAFSRSHLGSYCFAPFMPLLGVLPAVLPLMIVGLLMRADIGVLIAGILWPLVIVAGLFMAILLIGLLFGWPLMWPTISTEGTDAFEALSRAYAYTYQRPLHYLFYVVVASLVGLVGALVVDVFASAVLDLGTWAVSWGTGGARMDTLTAALDPGSNVDRWSVLGVGSGLWAFWIGCVRTIQIGFLFGFFWVSATASYLLLRRNVDATEMDEVYLDSAEEPIDLPSLADDDSPAPAEEDQ